MVCDLGKDIFSALTIVLSIAPDRRVLAVTASDP